MDLAAILTKVVKVPRKLVAQKNFDKKIKTICATVINKNMEIRKNIDTAERLMEIWNGRSVMSFERPRRIKQIIENSMMTRQPINIVNWICPAGTTLYFSPQGDTYQTYVGVSMEGAFINDHRLYPRLDLEKDLVKSFGKVTSLPKPTYFKIMADDNPLCLSPYGVQLYGKRPTMESIANYAGFVQDQLNILVGQNEIRVSTFSSLLGPKMFRRFVATFKNLSYEDIAPYLPKDVIENELRIAEKHMKVGPEILLKLDGYIKKVLRQYAVEGLYMYKIFGDNLIMAWNESTTRSQTMDSLRKKMGIPTIPKIFVLHRKEKNEIQDNS